MKNNKWLTYTLGVLLTLVVLAAVAGISFRIGMAQNPSFVHPAFTHGFNGPSSQEMQKSFPNNRGLQVPSGNFQNNDGQQRMQGNYRGNGWRQMPVNPRNQRFDSRENNHFGGRHNRSMFFFPFIFGLIHLAVLGLILWVIYMLVKKSGWRLIRVQETSPTPAPSTSETPSIVVDKKKKLK